MNSTMDQRSHHAAVQRAIALGRGTDPAVVPELIRLLSLPSAEVRRLAASALGKLAGFGADAAIAVPALAPVALYDPHPQAQQYALKALKCYGAASRPHLHDLDDLAANERMKDYVRRAAHSVKKQQLYQQEGKRLISLYPADKSRLGAILRAKLALFGHNLPPGVIER